MKTKQSASKPKNQLTNMLMQLLDWLTHLELSGGHTGEQNIGQLMPEPAFAGLIKENRINDNYPINEIQMKPNNQLTNMLLELLHWMSHLELSGGQVGRQYVGQLVPMTAFADSIKWMKNK